MLIKYVYIHVHLKVGFTYKIFTELFNSYWILAYRQCWHKGDYFWFIPQKWC